MAGQLIARTAIMPNEWARAAVNKLPHGQLMAVVAHIADSWQYWQSLLATSSIVLIASIASSIAIIATIAMVIASIAIIALAASIAGTACIIVIIASIAIGV